MTKSKTIQALSTPEIVGIIAAYLQPDKPTTRCNNHGDGLGHQVRNNKRVLLNAMLVNKLWLQEAARILYSTTQWSWQQVNALADCKWKAVYLSNVKSVAFNKVSSPAPGLKLPALAELHYYFADKEFEQVPKAYLTSQIERAYFHPVGYCESPTPSVYNKLGYNCESLQTLAAPVSTWSHHVNGAIARIVKNAPNLTRVYLSVSALEDGVVELSGGLLSSLFAKPLRVFDLQGIQPPAVYMQDDDDDGRMATIEWDGTCMSVAVPYSHLEKFTEQLKATTVSLQVLMTDDYGEPYLGPNASFNTLHLRNLKDLCLVMRFNVASCDGLVALATNSPELQRFVVYSEPLIDMPGEMEFRDDSVVHELTQEMPKLKQFMLDLPCCTLTIMSLLVLATNCQKLESVTLGPTRMTSGTIDPTAEQYKRMGLCPPHDLTERAYTSFIELANEMFREHPMFPSLTALYPPPPYELYEDVRQLQEFVAAHMPKYVKN